jgi:integrase/recombinase XerD
MSSTTSLNALVEDYLADCRARGLSPKTLRDAYGYPLQKVLLPWCEGHGITVPGQLDARALNRFTSDLLEHGGRRGQLSRHTVNTYVRNVNLFLAWCRREGEIGDVRAQAPKLPRRVIDVLTRDEIDRLEDVATAERDKVIVRLLGDTGIRASELLGLRSPDLVERGRDRFVRILGPSRGGGAKGDRDRLVPVHPQLYRRLQRLDRGRPDDAPGDWLFLARRRQPGGVHERLTVSGLDQLIRGLGERAGIGKRVYPHLLRHSFATEMLNRGMDAITLSRILGHSSLAMIQRTYAHQNVADLSAALLRALLRDPRRGD